MTPLTDPDCPQSIRDQINGAAQPTTQAIQQALIDAATTAFNEACSNPVMVECSKCQGRGFHHGFGESGHDPDWCSECGGGGGQL